MKAPGDSRRLGGASILIATLLLISSIAPARAAEPAAQRDFEDENWAEGLVDLRSLDLTRTDIVEPGFVGCGLEVTIPVGGFRGFGPFDRLPIPEPDEAWYRYHVRLLDWNSVSSGKLPGLSGLYSHTARGCNPSEPGAPGWSARGLFGAAGSQGARPGEVPIGTYLYHLDQPGPCGELLYWPGASLEQDRWQCVEGYVRLNTPGENDGAIRGWLDGEPVFSRGSLAMRRTDETDVSIREMWLNVYFGGSWSTPNQLGLVLDEVEVSTEGRVGCVDPFFDDNNSMHQGAITELHALGFLRGCGERKACPDQMLTRGEIAAFVTRIMGLAAASQDYFTDDSSSIFEQDINRMAAAGIARGCDPPLNRSYCPDRAVSRAEFAVVAVRALGLSPSSDNAFSDDNGHWAEDEINAFAAAGVTRGCGADRFCPNDHVTRAEAATFLVRMIHISRSGFSPASADAPTDWPPPGEPPPIPVEERD